MQKIISSLVILLYDQLFHPNPRIFMYGTRSCLVVSATYLPKVFILNYYYRVIFIRGR